MPPTPKTQKLSKDTGSNRQRISANRQATRLRNSKRPPPRLLSITAAKVRGHGTPRADTIIAINIASTRGTKLPTSRLNLLPLWRCGRNQRPSLVHKRRRDQESNKCEGEPLAETRFRTLIRARQPTHLVTKTTSGCVPPPYKAARKAQQTTCLSPRRKDATRYVFPVACRKQFCTCPRNLQRLALPKTANKWAVRTKSHCS